MIRRVADIDELGEFCIDQRIRDDMSPVIANSNNVVLLAEHAVAVFVKRQQAIFEIYVECLQAGRGRWAATARHAALAWMFVKTDALEIFGIIPKGNIAALTLARMSGFEKEFTLQAAFARGGRTIDAHVYSLSFQKWLRTSPIIDEHACLLNDAVARELGDDWAPFGVDAIWARQAALAIMLIRDCNFEKAIVFYNRYAAMTGVAPLYVPSIAPLTLVFGNVSVVVEDDGCRILTPNRAQTHNQEEPIHG